MIHVQPKRYQVALWESADRKGPAAALRLDFDNFEEAQAALEAQRQTGRYRTGILMEWHKLSGVWDLIDSYDQ